MKLFHPTKGEIDFSTADYKTLLALSKTKGMNIYLRNQ